MDALQYVDCPGYAALLLRRTFADLAKPGALMERAHGWLKGTEARWVAQEKKWVFPSGATMSFGYLEKADDHYQYQGSEYQYIAFDELTQFPERQYRYLFSRLRRLAGSDIPIRMRAGSNPGGRGHAWVFDRFIKDGNTASRVFVPSTLDDNPYLDREEYERSLDELDPVERERLRHGNWYVQREGLVFPGLESCVVPPGPVPEGRCFGGIDWGWHNPFAALGGVLDHDDVLWITWERYASETPVSDHARAIKDVPGDRKWFADPAGADQIGEMRRTGVNVVPCVHKGSQPLIASVDRVNRRIRDGKLKVFSTCGNLRREAGIYHYDPDKARDIPVDADNHACSALRYLVTGIDRNTMKFTFGSDEPTPDPVKAADDWARIDNPAFWGDS